VTDDAVLARESFPDLACGVLEAGGRELALHIRGPGSSGRHVYQRAQNLLEVARSTGSMVLVNDRVDVALALGLPGVHLGARSLPVETARGLLGSDPVIGASVHTLPEARDAERRGADFLLAGTIFDTRSHPGRAGVGVGPLARIVGAVELPVLAIGGITIERVASVMETGAHGVSLIRGIWDAPSPALAVRQILDRLRHAHGGR
jgi:thiamine-phosphate pyrophosphorylase